MCETYADCISCLARPHKYLYDVKMQSSENMENKLKCVLVAILCAALAACKGAGLDATLDASNGFDVNYHTTLSKAFEKMTGDQQNIYNWAVENLTEGEFIADYGKKPTVREVIKGQVKMAVDANRAAILNQSSLIEQNANEIAERTRVQEKARQLLQTITATASIERAKNSEKTCQGVVCGETPTAVIHFVIHNPNDLKLEQLPCSAVITPVGSGVTYTYDLSDNCSGGDDKLSPVQLPAGVSFDGAKIEIKFDFEDAETDGFEKAIPDSLDVTKTMVDLENQRQRLDKIKISIN